MELTTHDLEILAAYDDGTLNNPTKTALEQRLKTDKVFQKAVLEWRLKKAALETVRQEKRRAFLMEVDKKMPAIPQPQPALAYMRVLKVAAAAAILGAIAWFVVPVFSPQKPVYAAHFKPFPAYEQRKGAEAERLRQQAFEDYEKADYCKAMPNFNKAFKLQNDTILHFYYGIAAVGCGDFKEAQPVLESLQTSNVVPTEHLPYYLGLTYANTGQNDRAKMAFEKAIQTSERFKRDAIEALETLKRNSHLK
jgi:tetratricopeptide (TPR) repeat protein